MSDRNEKRKESNLNFTFATYRINFVKDAYIKSRLFGLRTNMFRVKSVTIAAV